MKRKLFVRITEYYLILICVIMVILFFALHYVFKEYKEDVVAATCQLYENQIEKIDSDIRKFSDISKEIYTDDTLSKEIFELHGVEAILAHKKLQLYKNSLELIEDLVLYFDSNKLYTQDGSVSLDVYIKQTLNLNMESETMFKKMLEERANNTTLVVENNEGDKGILYVYSSPVSSKINVVTVVFYVSEEILDKILQGFFGVYDSVAMMRTNKGEILSCGSNIKAMTENALNDFCMQIQENGVVDHYTVIECESEQQGYSVYLAISEKQFWDRQFKIQIIFLIGTVFVFVFLMIVIFFINRRFYEPITEIAQMIVNQNDQKDKSANDEYDIIRNAISQNARQSLYYQESYSAILAKVRDTVTLLLCSGVTREEEKLVSILGDFNLLPEMEYYTVVGILLNENSESLYDYLISKKRVRYCAFSEMDGKSLLIAIIELSDLDIHYDTRESFGKDIFSHAKLNEVICHMVAFGIVYNSLQDICISYREMISVIESGIKEKKFGIISYFEEKAKINVENHIFLSQRLTILSQALQKGDIPKAKDIIYSLGDVYRSESNVEKVRFYKYSVVQVIINIIVKDNQNINTIKEVSQLYFLRNLEFEKTVCEYLERIVTNYSIKAENLADEEKLILDYIHEHFAEALLSQDMVSDAFGVSRQKINSIVKSSVGMTYSNYVSYLRLEYAGKLLRETDLNVADIAERVGYSDNSRFISKFQLYYKMTPGQYRRSEQQLK